MNVDYLKLLEQAKSDDFSRSHDTHVNLNTKTIAVIVVYSGFLSAVVSYSVTSFSSISFTEKIFLLCLFPPIIVTVAFLYKALKSRDYFEGMDIPEAIEDMDVLTYYQKRIKFLIKAFNHNCLMNSAKSRALNCGVIMFLASFLIAGFSTAISVFFDNFSRECICVYIATLVASAILTIFTTHFFTLFLKKNDSE